MKVPNTENIHIIFHHDSHGYKIIDDWVVPYIEYGRKSTICRIYKDKELLGEGKAECSMEDQFSRSIGREYATLRALKNSNLDLENKEKIINFVESFPSHKRSKFKIS